MRVRNKADSGQNFDGRAGSSWGAEKKHNDNEHGASKRKRLEKRGSNRKNRARASQRELEKAVPRRKGLPVLRAKIDLSQAGIGKQQKSLPALCRLLESRGDEILPNRPHARPLRSARKKKAGRASARK